MSRVTFTDIDGKLSWFDDDAARAVIGEGHTWTGENWIGACSGLQTARAYLYLTSGGRWIEHQDRTREFNGSDLWRFLTDDQAREWLMRSADAGRDTDDAEDALAKHFPEIPEESGLSAGGRPAVGPTISVAYPRPAGPDRGRSRGGWHEPGRMAAEGRRGGCRLIPA
jgi:hypothetical protein